MSLINNKAQNIIYVFGILGISYIGYFCLSPVFLKHTAPVSYIVVLALITSLLVFTQQFTSKQYYIWVAKIWFLWSFASIIWSYSPATTLKTVAWHFTYACFLIITANIPSKASLSILLSLHTIALIKGIDLMIVLEKNDFSGVWFQQNIQGAHFLISVPLVTYLAFSKNKYAPYWAIPLGLCIFLSCLTFSIASQILLLVGILAICLFQNFTIKLQKSHVIYSWLIIIAVFTLSWLIFKPQGIQVFGITFGDVETGTITSSVSDTLIARAYLLQDVLKGAFKAFPLGTGAGTLRDIYSSLQSHAGTESVDAHNYYVQTLLTLGPLGLILFLAIVLDSLYKAWKLEHWGLFIAIGLFSGYLAFDVMAYFPGIMMLFFMTLGALQGLWLEHLQKKTPSALIKKPVKTTSLNIPNIILALLLLGFAGYWMWCSQPCYEFDCFVGRKIVDRNTILTNLPRLTPQERLTWARAGVEKTKQVLFYEQLIADSYQQLQQYDNALKQYKYIADNFPASDIRVYQNWYNSAILASNPQEASFALRQSMNYFVNNNYLILH